MFRSSRKKTLAAALTAAAILTIVVVPGVARPFPDTYNVAPRPGPIFAGLPIPIDVSVRGGIPNCTYSVTVSVNGPGGVSATDSVTLKTTPSGNGLVAAIFPNDCTGTASTDAVGSHSVLATFACGYTTATASSSFHVTPTPGRGG